jgi:prevent-host-death family protein
MRTTVSIAQLKARLSEHLRHVKRGNEIVITERGTPVARLAALDSTERRATRRDRLARTGTLRAGKGRVRKLLLTPPAGDAVGRDVLDTLVSERRDDR